MIGKKGKRGGAALEAALVLPILIFVALSMFIFPVCFYNKIVFTDVARDAARYVAIHNPNPEDVRSYVEQLLQETRIGGAHLLSGYGGDGSGVGKGVHIQKGPSDYVTVTLNYVQPTIFPQMTALIGGEPMDDYLLISVSSSFKKEWRE